MKKVFVLSLLISIGVFCHAQVDTISTNIFQKDGKLGIGTDAPDNALSITGSEDTWPGRFFIHILNTSTSESSAAYMRIQSGPTESATALGHISSTYTLNDDYAAIADYGRLTSSGPGLIIDATKQSGDAGVIKFTSGTGPGSALTEHMRIIPGGNVGIGTKEPVEKLDINGGLKIGNTENLNSGTIRWTGTDFEGYDGLGWKSFTTGSGDSYWNANGNDLYYTNGRIGIGTDAPDNSLSIVGSEDTWPGRFFIHVNNTSTSETSAAYIRIQSGPTESATALGHISSTYTMNDDYEAIADFGRLTSSGPGLIIDATKQSGEAGIIKFTSGTSPGTTLTEHMRIIPGGNVGIGTTNPIAKLEVANGDIFISDIESGIIMKSPDGNCWRGTVDNSGTLNFVKIDCQGTVGIYEEPKPGETTNVDIFPNPTSSIVSVQVTGDKSDLVLKIYSMEGQLVEKKSLLSDLTEINITKYSGGDYLFVIENKMGKFISSAKVIKE